MYIPVKTVHEKKYISFYRGATTVCGGLGEGVMAVKWPVAREVQKIGNREAATIYP